MDTIRPIYRAGNYLVWISCSLPIATETQSISISTGNPAFLKASQAIS